MIPAKDQPRRVESLDSRHIGHQAAKILRLHPGITALMIHLVGGGFDQQRRPILQCLVNGCFQHPGMRGTNRVDALRLALLPPCG
jgi:hypothetical protein